MVTGILFGAGTSHALYTYNGGTTANDDIVFGCRAGKTVVCEDGVETVVETDCTLSDSVQINGNGGNDSIAITRAYTAYACGAIEDYISPVSYNGYYVDAVGGGNDDTLEGGTGDHVLSGGDGDDFITLYSSVGWTMGGAGGDRIVASISSSGWEVYGNSGNDCVETNTGGDPDLPDVLDCGSDTDEYVDINGFSEVSCETTVASCS
jgi:hypothetical protein